MIFIARNPQGFIVSIVSAIDKKAANAYWQGAGTSVYSVEEFDMAQERENEKIGYVTPILKTKETQLWASSSQGLARFLVIVEK